MDNIGNPLKEDLEKISERMLKVARQLKELEHNMSCGCNENKKMTLKEELEVNDIQQIRKLIRHELARVFFDLYRKKKQWEG